MATARILISIAMLLAPSLVGAGEPLGCLTHVRALLQERGAERLRKFPGELDVPGLEPAQVVYVMPEAFQKHPSLKKRINGPVRLTVSGKQGQKGILFLESPELGRLSFRHKELNHRVFDAPPAHGASPFTRGEWVRVGDNRRTHAVYPMGKVVDGKIVFTDEEFKFIGVMPVILKYIGSFDDGHYAVSLNGKVIIVPKSHVFGLNAGTKAHFLRRLQPLLDHAYAFSSGEAVRYRDESGLMQQGSFVRKRGVASEIRSAGGKTLFLEERDVFKATGTQPAYTPSYNHPWMQAEFPLPTRANPALRAFLDGAAKISSHPDFAQMSDKKKLAILSDYTTINVSWRKSGSYIEKTGARGFEQIVCAGTGVCRHLSPLLATVLHESGIRTRLMKYIPKSGAGHAWVEADFPDSQGRWKTYIIDPNRSLPPATVLTIEEAKAKAAANPNSMAARFYLRPGREAASSERSGPDWSR